MSRRETRGERVIRFIQTMCRVPEGVLIGQPVKLLPFQREFILAIYDNPNGTSRAYLSIARKNAKTATIAMILLAHIVGPEAFQNSSIVSGARSRKQAAEVYKYASKMVMMSPELRKIIRPIPSQKTLIGLPMNVEYQAISADAAGAHGGSPILAILDEVGQVRGPYDAFIEAIETAQGAYEGRALLIAISTQAPTDNDLFSRWLDDAANANDPHIVSHVYTAPLDCDLTDREAWQAANPALGVFRSLQEVEEYSERAVRMPTAENTFRWLFLNQRVEASSPFVSRNAWAACGGLAKPLDGVPVYGGLDLSSVSDLTAFLLMGNIDGIWHVHPTFWLPGDMIAERSRADRVPYDLWHKQGLLKAAPGNSVDYEFVAQHIWEQKQRLDIRKIGFDRAMFKHLRPWLIKAGFSEVEIEDLFEEVGQGYVSMSPALRDLEAEILNCRIAHGVVCSNCGGDGCDTCSNTGAVPHPVLQINMANAIVMRDPAGNRKLDKQRANGRIDGAAALADAFAAAPALDESASPMMFFLGAA